MLVPVLLPTVSLVLWTEELCYFPAGFAGQAVFQMKHVLCHSCTSLPPHTPRSLPERQGLSVTVGELNADTLSLFSAWRQH